MMKSLAGLALATMLLSACGSSDDTSNALSAVCDSQDAVLEDLAAMAALDPAVNTTAEYQSAVEDLQSSVDDLKAARSDLSAENVDNITSAYDELRAGLDDLDDLPLAEADATLGSAIDVQVEQLTSFYDAAFAESSCSE